MPTPKPLTAQVRDILNRDPRSYYRIARDAGIHTSSVTRFAAGGTPNCRVLDSIAAVLGIHVIQKAKP